MHRFRASYRFGRRYRTSRSPQGRNALQFALHGRRLLAEPLEPRHMLSGVPELAVDVNRWGDGSRSEGFLDVGGVAFFTALTPEHGDELWRSDGTSAGTLLVKDIRPGPLGAGVLPLAELAGALIFTAKEDGSAHRLWRSDGTNDGTVKLSESIESPAFDSFAKVGTTLFIKARDATHGHELWKTDGTPEGTVLVKDIVPGPGGSFPFQLTDVNGELFFRVGNQLWKSDGTETGTVMLKDFNPTYEPRIPLSLPLELENVNGTLFFVVNDGMHGSELWKSDGTALGTVLVKDILRGESRSSPSYLTSAGGLLFFAADDGVHGRELWRSDGTDDGTYQVKDINDRGSAFSWHGNFRAFDDRLVFSAFDEVHGRELWISDGTDAGTHLIKDIRPGRDSSSPSDGRVIEGRLYFAAADAEHGAELWTSDGTEAGTIMVRDIWTGPYHSLPADFTALSTGLLFHADNGLAGDEIWFTDGTAEGTRLVADLWPRNEGSRIDNLTSAGPWLYFTAVDRVHNWEVWRSDGTQDGTALRAEAPLGHGPHVVCTADMSICPIIPDKLTPFGDEVFYALPDPQGNRTLWRTHSLGDDAFDVRQIQLGPNSLSPHEFLTVDDILFITTRDQEHGMQLWKTDGTQQGAVFVKDLAPWSQFGYPNNLIQIQDSLFFTTDDEVHGRRLWTSDGTTEGTSVLAEFEPFSIFGFPLPHRLVSRIGDTLFFVADDGTHGVELWQTDGTVAGTKLVRDITSGPASTRFGPVMVDLDGTLLFSADDGVAAGLYRSDGTAAGTVLVKDVWPNIGAHNFRPPVPVAVADGMLFFSANDDSGLPTLYTSDGTTEGTVSVKQFDNGGETVFTHQIQYLTNVGGTVFFHAFTVDSGRQLWQSDGTAAGTIALDAQVPLPASTTFHVMTAHKGALYFDAFDEATGWELWKLDPLPGDTNFDGVVDIDDLNNVRNHFGRTGTDFPGDVNGDGVVDIEDLILVRNNFGTSIEGGARVRAGDADDRISRVTQSAGELVARRRSYLRHNVADDFPFRGRRQLAMTGFWRAHGARGGMNSPADVWAAAYNELIGENQPYSLRPGRGA